ncbi:head-tail adaptor protein [Novosphingobium olei]|uniref:head-tail adaptor protein n=1 Tax=Novosphingobium olei TaxID=2728851 RepID=UPI00308D05A0|nr:head-tail adaptor protein [Novosphingobium olei]
MTLPAGRRDKRVTFQRNGAARSALGGKAAPAWSDLCSRFASVTWGTSAERRAAAGEQAVQTATFRVLADSTVRTVTVRDRISHDGLAWDITGVAPIGGASATEIEFTATAARS